jgi:hypothetical protein
MIRALSYSKFGNVRVEEDGYTFDSKAEYRRYCDLRLRAQVGDIWGLEVHPRYDLIVDGKKVGTYIADFRYHDVLAIYPDAWIVEDVKGVKTEAYRLKKKMMKAQYGIDITEVTA